MPRDIHKPIEDIFPTSFSTDGVQDNTGIFVTQNTIHNVPGYEIDSFPESEQNRNHYDSRDGKTIEYLIMHYTESNFASTIKLFTDNKPSDRVSAHYVITEPEHEISGGQVFQVVQDTHRAWHAKRGAWEQDQNINTTSVGIQHVNQGLIYNQSTQDRTWHAFDEQQIVASGTISRAIVAEYGIHPTHVLGHADIAPDSEQAPGILFPWEQLYSTYQVGTWLNKDEMNSQHIVSLYEPKTSRPETVNLSLFLKMLNAYGYKVPQELLANPRYVEAQHIIRAFKSHFSDNQEPALYNSHLDMNDMYWAWALNAKYHPDIDVELAGE